MAKSTVKTDDFIQEQPAAAPVAERTVKPIKPAHMMPQSDGFRWREIFVRLPQGVVLQDLVDHSRELWKLIQDSPAVALRRWDRLRLVAFDESWVADATVAIADRQRVILTGIRKFDMPTERPEWEDQTVRVVWNGTGYAVVRKSDGQQLYGGFHNTEAAKAEYLRRQPRAV